MTASSASAKIKTSPCFLRWHIFLLALSRYQFDGVRQFVARGIFERLQRDDSGLSTKLSKGARATRVGAAEAWHQVARGLASSADQADRELARAITEFVRVESIAGALARTVRTTELAHRSKPLEVEQRR